MVDPEGMDREESLDMEVCTPQWLEEIFDIDEIVVGRHHLIVRKYDYDRLIALTENFLKNCSDEDWNEVAQKVSRLGRRKFEDYVE